MPRALLVGRNPAKLEAISAECGGLPWTTDLEAALANPEYSVYFDAQTTDRRAAAHPPGHRRRGSISIAKSRWRADLESALDLWKLAEKAGVKHGVVQDKLWLPGLLSFKR